MVNILKQGKCQLTRKTDEQFMVLLVWSRLLSRVVVTKNDGTLQKSLDRSQHALSKDKSVGYVVLTTELLLATSTERQFNPKVEEIDFWKAFDTV